MKPDFVFFALVSVENWLVIQRDLLVASIQHIFIRNLVDIVEHGILTLKGIFHLFCPVLRTKPEVSKKLKQSKQNIVFVEFIYAPSTQRKSITHGVNMTEIVPLSHFGMDFRIRNNLLKHLSSPRQNILNLRNIGK